ncbi:hypothetical protein RG959_09350 [Domibacillus sp. 8LH]|uniref:hypothetical protein n=1 Tax=Domibacillus sp. 8LH TaxID=3073900 RepID=UPI00316B9ED6
MQMLLFENLPVPLEWILAFISLLGGWLIVKWYARHHQIPHENNEVVMNSLFIWGIVWKFSIILFNPSMVKAEILSIIYFSGGEKGFFLGALISIGFLVWKAKKGHIWCSLSEAIIVFGTASYGIFLVLTSFVQREGIVTIFSLAATSVFLIMWLWEVEAKSPLPQKAGIIFIVFGLLFHMLNEAPLIEIWITVMFPLLSILFYKIPLKGEKI